MAVVVNPVFCVRVDVGMDWFRTLTLYPLFAITVLFLLSLAFRVGGFLTLGLVLGWAGHD